MSVRYLDKTVEETVNRILDLDDAGYDYRVREIARILRDLVNKNVAKSQADLDPLNKGDIDD